MRLKKKIDIRAFLNQAYSCRGDVELHTSEGDCLNLKSILSRYLFAAISIDEGLLESAWIECHDETDYRSLEEFLLPD